MRSVVGILGTLALATQVNAQSPAEGCEVKRDPMERGGVANATMVMVNDGKPCRFVFKFGGQNPPDSWEVRTKPKSGTLEIKGDAVEYVPAAGFAGSDTFVVTAFGRAPGGKRHETRNGTFEVAVTVNPKP